jgi:hypothetical protein
MGRNDSKDVIFFREYQEGEELFLYSVPVMVKVVSSTLTRPAFASILIHNYGTCERGCSPVVFSGDIGEVLTEKPDFKKP